MISMQSRVMGALRRVLPSVRWTIAVWVISAGLGIALGVPLFGCPTCRAIASIVQREGCTVQGISGPLRTGCPDCRDSGRVSGFRRLRPFRADPALLTMIQNPLLVPAPGKNIDFGAMDAGFQSSLKDVVARSGHQEARALLREFADGRFCSGQAAVVSGDNSPLILCRLVTRGALSHRDSLSGLILFDASGQVLDVVSCFTPEASWNEADLLGSGRGNRPAAQFYVAGQRPMDVTLLHGGKDEGFFLPPAQAGKGRTIPVLVQGGKLLLQSKGD
jgi:hypothetical protein